MNTNTTPIDNVISLDEARHNRKVRKQVAYWNEVANECPQGSDEYHFYRAIARDDSAARRYYSERLEATGA